MNDDILSHMRQIIDNQSRPWGELFSEFRRASLDRHIESPEFTRLAILVRSDCGHGVIIKLCRICDRVWSHAARRSSASGVSRRRVWELLLCSIPGQEAGALVVGKLLSAMLPALATAKVRWPERAFPREIP